MNYNERHTTYSPMILSLYKIKVFLFSLFLFSLFFLCSDTSQAVRLSKDQFMQQYSTKFINDFPADSSRRAVMQQWCNAITDPSILATLPIAWAKQKDTIDWFFYASGTYTSPNQSALAYIICSPFLDGPKTKDRFHKKLIAATKTTQRDKISTSIDSKQCPISTTSNNLNDCNIMDAAYKVALTVFNDLTNIRHGTSRWYIATNEDDIGYFAAQHFAQATWSKSLDRIKSVNTVLCNNENAPYFGEWKNKVPRCGFPTTHNTIILNAKKGKEILNKTIAINGERLLWYECDSTDSGANLIWCGINDHSSTQAYNDMIYNETWFYEQFLAMYESISSLNTTFLVGNQIGLGKQWQDQLLNQIRINRQQQSKLISHAIQVSINLISQFESAYPLHIWLLAADEASATAVTKYIKPRQNSIKFWMIRLLNTQKK
jgi:hypothetical protein